MRRLAVCFIALLLFSSPAVRGEDTKSCPDESSECQKGCDVPCAGPARDDVVDHVQKAAEHLRAAGMETEAKQLLGQIETLRRDLLALKIAELDRLQVDVDKLRHATGKPQQVMVKVQIAEVSLTNLRRLGLQFPAGELADETGDDVDETQEGLHEPKVDVQLCESEAIARFIMKLQEERLIKILAEPALVTLDGRPAHFSHGLEVPRRVGGADSKRFEYHKLGTEIDLVPTLLGDHKVRVQVRPRLSWVIPAPTAEGEEPRMPTVRYREVDAACEMKLGQTALIGGAVEKRAESIRKGVQEILLYNEVQTLFLITPALVDEPHQGAETHVARPPSATLQK
jgi:Flp pilus assembly secretin CpaC